MKYACILLLCIPLICFAHSKVIATDPVPGSVLQNPPDIVTIHFNKTIEPNFNKAEIWSNSAWSPVTSNVEARKLVIRLNPAYKSEKKFRIRWSVISQDGHRQRGVLEFSVK